MLLEKQQRAKQGSLWAREAFLVCSIIQKYTQILLCFGRPKRTDNDISFKNIRIYFYVAARFNGRDKILDSKIYAYIFMLEQTKTDG